MKRHLRIGFLLVAVFLVLESVRVLAGTLDGIQIMVVVASPAAEEPTQTPITGLSMELHRATQAPKLQPTSSPTPTATKTPRHTAAPASTLTQTATPTVEVTLGITPIKDPGRKKTATALAPDPQATEALPAAPTATSPAPDHPLPLPTSAPPEAQPPGSQATPTSPPPEPNSLPTSPPESGL